jgi:hypothetical protein
LLVTTVTRCSCNIYVRLCSWSLIKIVFMLKLGYTNVNNFPIQNASNSPNFQFPKMCTNTFLIRTEIETRKPDSEAILLMEMKWETANLGLSQLYYVLVKHFI